MLYPERVTIKTQEEIELIKKGGKLLGEILKKVAVLAKPGVTTGELEEESERLILAAGGRPAFKGYTTKGERPYPTVLCTSVNDEVVHATALPPRVLKEGDIIGIDIGMEYPFEEVPISNFQFSNKSQVPSSKLTRGYFTDTAVTVGVGKISKDARRLIEITRKALYIGIKTVKPGRMIGDIGKAIEKYVSKEGLGIVRDLVGHGVGYEVHEPPRIPNYFDKSLPPVEIKDGMVLAIEPMLTLGDWRIETGIDGFSIKTADGSLSAHFEHTVVVTRNGCDIVT